MKNLLSIVLFGLAFSVSAQNYSLFPDPTDTLSFADTSGYISHVKFDSVKTLGNRMIYFPIKEVGLNVNDTCYGKTEHDGWMGGRVEDSLGHYKFFHPRFELNQDVHNRSNTASTAGWLMEYNHWCRLDVRYDSTTYQPLFHNQFDSVRHFTISVVDTSTSGIDYSKNLPLAVAKNHGLQTFPTLTNQRGTDFDYNNSGSSQKISTDVLTNADLYDYEIGDEFHYEFWSMSYAMGTPMPGRTEYSRLTVADKQVFPAKDSIYYKMVNGWNSYSPQSPPGTAHNSGYDTTEIFVGKASAPASEKLSWQVWSPKNNSFYVPPIAYWHSNILNGRRGFVTQEASYEYFSADSSCFDYGFEPLSEQTEYAEGIGIVSRSGTNQSAKGPWSYELVYYKKGSETWGTPLSGIGSEESSLSRLKLYPNPVRHMLTIELPLDEASAKVILLNQMGQKLQVLNLHAGVNELSLNDYPAGIYYLQNQGKTLKIVKY